MGVGAVAKRTINEPWSVQGKLKDSLVAALTPPAVGNKIRWHGELAGFGCRVTAAGAKAYVFRYRNGDGRDRTITIGDSTSWPIGKAIEQAKSLRRKVDDGQDPLAERQDQRSAPTIADLADRFEREHMAKLRPSTARDYLAMLKTIILPAIGTTKVTAIRYSDIDRLHHKVAEHAPYRANRVVALLSRMFSLAIRWEWRSDNPCRTIERAPEQKRERFLSPREIAALSEALNAHPEKLSANAIRLLLLTGARRGEVLSATWDQFNLEAGIWTKPYSATKQRREHRVPLSAPALQLLVKMQEAAADGQRYVFPGTNGGYLTEVKKSWASVCGAAGIEGARLHDLRHSFASVLASSGLSLPIIGQLLGHSNPTTTSRYAHLLDSTLRNATEQAGAIIGGGKVVPMKKRRSR
jgi:integrase